MSGLELPAVTTVPPATTGRRAASASRLVSRRMPSSSATGPVGVGDGDDLVVEAAGVDRGGRALVAPQREGVGVLAGDAVDAGHLFAVSGIE